MVESKILDKSKYVRRGLWSYKEGKCLYSTNHNVLIVPCFIDAIRPCFMKLKVIPAYFYMVSSNLVSGKDKWLKVKCCTRLSMRGLSYGYIRKANVYVTVTIMSYLYHVL